MKHDASSLSGHTSTFLALRYSTDQSTGTRKGGGRGQEERTKSQREYEASGRLL